MGDREAQIRAIYEAVGRDDFEATEGLVAAEFEWHPNRGEPDTAVRHGPREATAQAREVTSAFSEFRTEVEEVRELGDMVVAAVRHVAKPAGSGDHVVRREAHLWQFAGGRAVSLREYSTVDAAVEAARGFE